MTPFTATGVVSRPPPPSKLQALVSVFAFAVVICLRGEYLELPGSPLAVTQSPGAAARAAAENPMAMAETLVRANFLNAVIVNDPSEFRGKRKSARGAHQPGGGSPPPA